jgi:prolyl 4-hydroxylase
VLKTHDREIRVLARLQQPVLALLGDVMSAEECKQLIELARPRLKPSTIVDLQSGQDVVTAYRNSLGMFFRLQETAFIARLDRRISELMNLPVENGEGLQVLYYPTGAASAPHVDFLQISNEANRASIARSGQRVSTLVTYLNDVPAGGETSFPELGWAATPCLGHAVYFEYCDSRGLVDWRSVHAGNPVLEGEKWVASKWMRQRRFASAG